MEAGVKSREERETAVEAPDQVRAILKNLGYRPVFRYQKYRESWEYKGQEIEVDETPIGAFLEIEGDPWTLISWGICGREHVILERNGVVRDVLVAPAEAAQSKSVIVSC
ncbi:MAG: CYTH domain-containing protein, partial [bacterium]